MLSCISQMFLHTTVQLSAHVDQTTAEQTSALEQHFNDVTGEADELVQEDEELTNGRETPPQD